MMIPRINEKEYKRLYSEEINKQTSWILRSNLCVNLFINDIFEENKFLEMIVFDKEYDILKNDSSKTFTDNIREYFDHKYAVSLRKNVSRIEAPETISGIMNFPYLNWNQVGEFIEKIPDNWTLFIINPILMRYSEGSIGLFFTPKYCDNYYIGEVNKFIQSKTGYPLFLEYAKEDYVKKIIYNKPELSLENYIKEMKAWGKNKGLSKLLDFWKNNDCVEIDSFEDSFNDYKDDIPYLIWHDINLITIESNIPFELIHEENGEILGPYNLFCLDKSFKVADIDNTVLKLNSSQIDDLLEGKYDFKLTE